MDNNILELDNIISEFNMDMFINEYNNFSNIINRHINGKVINESVLHEGFKESFKALIKKAKDAIKKLIDKIKEFFKNLAIKWDQKVSKRHYKLDKLPDNYTIHNVLPFDLCFKMYDDYVKNKETIINSIDKVANIMSKLDKGNNVDADKQSADLIDAATNELLNNVKFFRIGADDRVSVNAAEIKKNFNKLIEVKDKIYKESFKIQDLLLAKLRMCDTYIGDIGKWNVDLDGNIDRENLEDTMNNFVSSFQSVIRNFVKYYSEAIKITMNLSSNAVTISNSCVTITNELNKVREIL